MLETASITTSGYHIWQSGWDLQACWQEQVIRTVAEVSVPYLFLWLTAKGAGGLMGSLAGENWPKHEWVDAT